jgi:hypothetical protein
VTERDPRLERRLGALAGAGREDWHDVRRRAKAYGYAPSRRRWIVAAVVTAALTIAAGPPIGRSVADLFRDPEKPALPRTFVEPLMRLSLDRQYGEWSIHQIASDGRTTFYSLRNVEGEVVCVMHGRADWKDAGWRGPFGLMACGDPGRVLPAARPLYYQVAIQMTPTSGGPQPFRVTGVAEDGIEKVVLTGTGERIEFDVEGHAFTIERFPKDAQSIRIAALDGDGNVVHSEPLQGFGPAPPPDPTPPPSPTRRPAPASPPPLAPRRGERPLQRGRSPDADLRVYRDGLMIFRIERGSRAARLATSNVSCLRYTEIDGQTHPVWVGGGGNLAPDGTRLAARPHARLVDPPYDGCEVHGDFGRRWNDPRGTRSPVEIPLTAVGREYFDTRAVARDLAEFLRSPRIVRYRQALRTNAAAVYPAAAVIRRGLPSRVVAVASDQARVGLGQIGIWSDRRRLLVTGRIGGERLFIELDGGRIVRNNLRGLARLS